MNGRHRQYVGVLAILGAAALLSALAGLLAWPLFDAWISATLPAATSSLPTSWPTS
jgi:hypothetical protein